MVEALVAAVKDAVLVLTKATSRYITAVASFRMCEIRIIALGELSIGIVTFILCHLYI